MSGSRARLTSNPLLVDALLAAALTGLSIVTLIVGARDIGSYSLSSIVLLLLQTIPLVVRRLIPLPVLLLTSVATIAHAWLAEDALNTTLGSLIALFTVGERCDRRTSAAAALALGVAMGAMITLKAGLPDSLGSLVQTELAVLVAWTLGIWSRQRRAYVGTVEERAARAEREREARAERAVAAERERIARELHDVVTHHVSVIVIQAGAARRALERRPADVAEAIESIDATGRQALADMRRMLGIMGPAPVDSAGAAGSALEPMPSLEQLGKLIESVRAAGLPVELTIEGDRRPLDPGLELSAYRIIQEALTNSLKHARGARARVSVEYASTALEVRIADAGGTGSRDLGDTGGRGLIGMRERVAIFGGTFEAGPSDGGFRVSARLPLDVPAAPGPS